ncbi:hypothetical protein KP509_37G061500 [Ceratopteris richardii]|uniref:Uncharacterized protein n=1 Tax=Ceratopteris richardii TaxID=49495 RepID=A0A8T2Q9J2_CERRI|nr:hypothetical protein KP509_37G061500 [Ceratopteris richardii]
MLNLATSISYGFSGRDVVSLSPVCYSERHGSSFVTRANYSYNGNSSKERVVTLLDYGAGNVRSIRNAIQRLGYHINDVKCPEDISNADTLIFPGVGAFGAAMDFLHKNR